MKKYFETKLILGMVGRYIQGYGILDTLGTEVTAFGRHPFVLVDPYIWQEYKDDIVPNLEKEADHYEICIFEGECSKDEIGRVSELSQKNKCDVVVGIGGGKTLDTAKGICHTLEIPVVMVPTTASNDAPTSKLAVIYSKEGVLEEVLILTSNPQLVLVDTKVIASAPVRFLIAGIGDALATKFETEQCFQAGFPSYMGGRQTAASLNLSELCYQILREEGVKAKDAVQQQIVTPAVNRVIEANILLSGLGFENGGLSVAHGLTRGLSAIPELHASLHGEEVAFGLLVQFVLENRSLAFLKDIRQFYRDIGLPLRLSDLGLKSTEDHHYAKIASHSCEATKSHVYKMTTPVNEQLVKDALKMVDCMKY